MSDPEVQVQQPDLLTSVEAADLTAAWIGDCAKQLDGINFHNQWSEGGRQVYHFSSHIDGTLEEFSQEEDEAFSQRARKGYVDSVTIHINQESGQATSAKVVGYFPDRSIKASNVVDRAADVWVARFQLPSSHQPGEQQRVVLDTWVLPVTEMWVRNAAVHGGDGYSEEKLEQYSAWYEDFYATGADGIPGGAVNRTHDVLGRPGLLDPELQDRLGSFLQQIGESTFCVGIWIEQLHAKAVADEAADNLV